MLFAVPRFIYIYDLIFFKMEQDDKRNAVLNFMGLRSVLTVEEMLQCSSEKVRRAFIRHQSSEAERPFVHVMVASRVYSIILDYNRSCEWASDYVFIDEIEANGRKKIITFNPNTSFGYRRGFIQIYRDGSA